MLSYTYVTASCPPLHDGIESMSKSILVVPLHALPSLSDPREARVSRASSPYRFARTWAQHPRAQGDPSSSVLRDLPKPLRHRADDLQNACSQPILAATSARASANVRRSPGLRARSAGIAMSHQRQQRKHGGTRTGDLEPAPKRPGGAGFKALAKAPGTYIHAS
jgi:hypothetical protein